MANKKEVEIDVKVKADGVDQAKEKIDGLNQSVKEANQTTKDFGKSVKITYDEAGNATDVLVDKSLTLTKQQRAIKQQMEILTATGKAQSKEFTVLQKKYNDLGDGLAQNKARSQELFGTLSLLPGPIGDFAQTLQGGLDLLKTFSGIKLTDFKNQLKGVGEDLRGILNDFLGVKKAVQETGSTKKEETGTGAGTTAGTAGAGAAGGAAAGGVQTRKEITDALNKQREAAIAAAKATGDYNAKNMEFDATTGKMVNRMENLKTASGKAKTGIQAQKVATQELTAATTTATTAITILETALAALGIGIIIAGIATLISMLSELVFQTKASTKAFDDFAEGLKLSKEALDKELITLQNWSQDRINILKKNNADAHTIRTEEINGIKKQQEAVRRELKSTDEDIQNSLDTYMKYKGGRINNLFYKSEAEKALQNYQAALDRQKELTLKDIDLNQQIKNKAIDDDIATTEEGYAKQLADLDAHIQLVIDSEETNSTELTALLDRRAKMIIKHDKLTYYQQELLRKENNKKVVSSLDEDSKRVEAFLQRAEDIEIAAIENTEKGKEEAELKARTAKLNRDYSNLSYDKEFQKLSTEEKNKIYLDLVAAAEQDEIKIKEGYFLRKQKLDEEAALKEIKSAELSTENKLLSNQTDLLNDQFHYASLLKSGREFFESKFVDIRAAFNKEHDETNAKYQQELIDLKTALDAKKLTQEEYANQVIAVNQKIGENNQLQYDRNRQLDMSMIEAKKETAAATVKVAEEMVGLLTALGAFSTDWQIAAALADAILGIAKIITATQVAIAEFSASVAWMGPVGAAMATTYAVKQKIAAGIGIAAITVGAIGKINSVKAQANAGGGENKGERMMKNHEYGGMIEGPRHSSPEGGVPIMAEGGEAVMTRGAVTMFRPLLSAMNQMGGGTSFTKGASGMASFDNPKLVNPQPEPMIIKTYVVSNEMSNDMHRQQRLKDLSTI